MIITSRGKVAFISALLVMSMGLLAQTSAPETEKLQAEKELEVVNFKSIKKVLQHDGLSGNVDSKKAEVVIMKKEQVKLEKSRFLYPTEAELWDLTTEWWLVKNAQLLKWDFEKPDYGLEKSFKTMLENLGYYQKKFKILLVNSPSIVRAALPGKEHEMILLLSVPFIRALDLSKLEISLLLLEDFFRLEGGYFKKSVSTEKMRKLAGTNFQGQKPDLSMIEELLKNYSSQITDKGHSFQEQFEVTKKMDSHLKATPDLWNSYFRMLGKIDRFIKSNSQYKDYVRMYPSPEMQVKWLSPEEKTY